MHPPPSSSAWMVRIERQRVICWLLRCALRSDGATSSASFSDSPGALVESFTVRGSATVALNILSAWTRASIFPPT